VGPIDSPVSMIEDDQLAALDSIELSAAAIAISGSSTDRRALVVVTWKDMDTGAFGSRVN
jgi:hypothetical protein